MPETATLETPAQAVVEPTPVTALAAVEPVTPTPPAVATPAVPSEEIATQAQALEALFEAQTTGNTKEADRLRGLLDAARNAPVKAEPVAVEPVAVVEPPVVEPEPVIEPVAVEPAAVPDKDPNRLRITHLSEVDKSDQIAIHALTKKGVPLAEAYLRILGPLPGPQAAQPAAVEPAQPEPQSASISELESTVTDLERQIDQLADSGGLYGVDAGRLTKELSRANAKLEAARISTAIAERENARENGAFETQRAGSEDAARKQYPALNDPNSALFQLWYEYSLAAHNPEHPDHAKAQSIDGPVHFATKAAKTLGIKPAGEVTPAKPSAPVVPAPPVAQPPPATRPAAATKGSAPPPPAKTSADVAREAEAEFESASTGRFETHRRPIGGIITR